MKKVRVKGSGSTFALKCIDKNKLTTDSDKKTVATEKMVISIVQHPFLVQLVTTFQVRSLVHYIHAAEI